MEYRVNRRTGDRISVLGVGTSGLPAAGAKEGAATLEMALEQGINYFDLATADSACFPIFGAALAGVRRQVLYQVHFGANYAAGKPYSWTTDLETVKRSVAWQLEQLRTDYIDYGFIHCMDESGDWRRYVDNGVLQFLEALKAQGVVRHIGLSTHTPALAREVLDTGLADMMMFSINPSYDYQHGEYANGSATERMALYRRCEAEGVGISVMKAFAGGQLLDARTSPFGQALTEYQCIQYALDKPGVLTVLPGVRDRADLERVLGFLRAGEAERDYSVISSPWTPPGCASTATTASPAPPAWTWASSTSIMTWPVRGMPWRQSTTGACLWVRMPASAAATVTAGAPSMYPSRRGCGRSHPTSGRREGPGRSLHLCRLHQ